MAGTLHRGGWCMQSGASWNCVLWRSHVQEEGGGTMEGDRGLPTR